MLELNNSVGFKHGDSEHKTHFYRVFLFSVKDSTFSIKKEQMHGCSNHNSLRASMTRGNLVYFLPKPSYFPLAKKTKPSTVFGNDLPNVDQS